MFKKLAGRILINRVFDGKFQRNFQHDQAIKPHPGGAVGLVDVPAGGKGLAAVKNTDIVKTQKATLEYIFAFVCLFC